VHIAIADSTRPDAGARRAARGARPLTDVISLIYHNDISFSVPGTKAAGGADDNSI
jgi:hypothetical protein